MKYKSQKHKELAKRKRKIKLVLWIILISLICFATYYISHLPSISIEKVKVEGTITFDKNLIKEEVEKPLNNSYMGILNKATKITYPEYQTQKNIIDKYNRIKSIDFIFTPNEITAQVKERIPNYRICSDVDSSDDSCYVVDSDGYIFSVFLEEIQKEFSEISLVVDKSLVENPVEIGNRFFDDTKSSFINNLLDKLKSKEINYSHIKNGNEAVYIYLNESAYIRFTSTADLDNQLENLSISYKPLESIETENTLEYIDLRFDEKVYIKQKSTGEKVEESTQ